MCHLLLTGYEDVSSFLNQLKLKVQSDIVLGKQMTGTQAPSILASQSTEMYVSRPWPEMTDIINILIRCEFAYHVEFGFICDY